MLPYARLSEPRSYSTEYSIIDFEILGNIGRGGFATVLLARDKNCHEYFALKTIAKRNGKAKTNLECVQSEIDALCELRHEFIVSFFATFQDAAHVYFLLELAEGGTLADLLKRRRAPVDESSALFYVAEISIALHHVHSKGFIYRDLKLENILLAASGHIKLADFGLAMRVSDRRQPLAGTPQMIAPELISQSRYSLIYTNSVDWWALGLVICELILGTSPLSWVKGPEDIASLTHTFKRRLHLPEWSSFSIQISEECKFVISGFLELVPTHRLGCTAGLDELKEVPWFMSIQWTELEILRVQPPIQPETQPEILMLKTECRTFPAEKCGRTENSGAQLALAEQAAIAAGDVRELRFLGSAGGINAKDYDGRTPLHVICSGVNFDTRQGFARIRAMVRALRIVKILVEELGADVNAVDRWGSTPLQDAIRFDVKPIIDYLRRRGAKEGPSLHADICAAAATDDVELLSRHVRHGIDVKSPDNDGRTAMHVAAAEGSLKSLKYLVDEVGMNFSNPDRWGNTPLGNAIFAGRGAVVDFLRSRGAYASVHAPAKNANNAFNLFEAAARGNILDLQRILSSGDVDVNECDFDNRTALHIAAEEGKLESVRFLIECAGADISPVDRWGYTPLSYANRSQMKTHWFASLIARFKVGKQHNSKYIEIANFLVSQRADVNTRATSFQTPVMACPSAAKDAPIIPKTVQLHVNPLICPLQGEMFQCPMVAKDGFTYEHAAFEAWVGKHGLLSPVTGEKLLSAQLIPNRAIGAMIVRNGAKTRLRSTTAKNETTRRCRARETLSWVALLVSALIAVVIATVAIEKATREQDNSHTKAVEGLDFDFYYES